jgi:hypothetical protein
LPVAILGSNRKATSSSVIRTVTSQTTTFCRQRKAEGASVLAPRSTWCSPTHYSQPSTRTSKNRHSSELPPAITPPRSVRESTWATHSTRSTCAACNSTVRFIQHRVVMPQHGNGLWALDFATCASPKRGSLPRHVEKGLMLVRKEARAAIKPKASPPSSEYAGGVHVASRVLDQVASARSSASVRRLRPCPERRTRTAFV